MGSHLQQTMAADLDIVAGAVTIAKGHVLKGEYDVALSLMGQANQILANVAPQIAQAAGAKIQVVPANEMPPNGKVNGS